MSFEYLLLGHLLGDFTFQTDKIAENKTKQWKWNLCHAIIVTICMLIFALPLGSLIIGLVIMNGILHFAIDYYKSKLHAATPVYSLAYFLADQTLHLLIIFLISSFYSGNAPSLPYSRKLIDLLTIFVLISSCSSIIIKYILKAIFVFDSEEFFIGNEKNIGIITRIFIFTVLYSSKYFSDALILVIITILIAKVIYYYKRWHLMMKPAYFYTGLLIDFLIPYSLYYYVIK